MGVPAEGRARLEVDADLDSLASGGAEIVPLKVGPLDAGLLGPCEVRHEGVSEDQQRDGHDPHRHHLRTLHTDLPGFGCLLPTAIHPASEFGKQELYQM
jgi:hypothetical protein